MILQDKPPLYKTALDLPLKARGKVRDVYETELGLLIVSTDRLSAFDVVFPDPIPCKGEVLTRLASWWFNRTGGIIPNHLIDANPLKALGLEASHPELQGRCVLVKKAKMFPVECIVRGYLEGSAYGMYKDTGEVCGVKLPQGLTRRARLPEPIFTPTTKAEAGHDEPVSFEETKNLIGAENAETIRRVSIELFRFAHDLLLKKQIIVSDTKFEFGVTENEGIILCDEALTPDSSRFWKAETYTADGKAESLDKQYVRDYVESIGWNKQPPAPVLPPEVVDGMTTRYRQIFELITDDKF